MYFVKWAIKKDLKVFDLEDGKSKTMTPSVGEFSKFLDKIEKKIPSTLKKVVEIPLNS